MLVALGRHVYNQLQHFVANDESAVYLTRRVYGLTETAKLAAEFIDADNEQLKGLQKLLVEIVGFLSGVTPSAALTVLFMVTHSVFGSAERKEGLPEAFARWENRQRVWTHR